MRSLRDARLSELWMKKVRRSPRSPSQHEDRDSISEQAHLLHILRWISHLRPRANMPEDRSIVDASSPSAHSARAVGAPIPTPFPPISSSYQKVNCPDYTQCDRCRRRKVKQVILCHPKAQLTTKLLRYAVIEPRLVLVAEVQEQHARNLNVLLTRNGNGS